MSNDDLEFQYIHDPSLRNEMFGELKYAALPNGNRQVELVIMPGDQAGEEFSLNALAIDGSRSMSKEFARNLPPIMQDKHNKVQPFAREVGQFLASNRTGKTALAYWASGDDGSDVEPVGMFSRDEFAALRMPGPKAMGAGTQLMPIVRYFWDQVFAGTSHRGVAVILTDGMWSDDLEKDLFPITQKMCDEIDSGRRALMKIVILLYETEGNHKELEEIEKTINQLDDYNSGTDVDVWDSKWVKYLSTYQQLYIELVKEDSLNVGGRILDAGGNVLQQKDEFKFGIQFELPKNSPSFTLVLEGVGEYKQDLP